MRAVSEPSTARIPGASLRPGGRSAVVRHAVVDACATLLTESDFDSLTVARIAARAGVHESSIYRRWGSVEAVIADTLLDAVEASGSPPDTGSLQGDLVAFLSDLDSFFATPLGRVAFQMGLVARTPSEGRVRDLYLDRRNAWINDILHRGVQRGDLPRRLDVGAFVEVVLGPTFVRAAFGRWSAWSMHEQVKLAIEVAPKLVVRRRRATT